MYPDTPLSNENVGAVGQMANIVRKKFCRTFSREKMRVSIFGATGRTGKILVEQAMAAGHDVIAFARTPSKLEIQNPKLKIVQGDIADENAVRRAISGADAVISVLGPTSNNAELTVSNGMKNVLAAMRQENVKRLIVSTGAGVGDAGDQPKAMDKIIVALLKLVNKNVLQDMVNTVNLVRASDREWTIVRVPMLTDDAPTGNIRAGAVGKEVGTRIGRADMAAFILKQLNDATYIRRAPAISN